jgi:hypothetical protein
VASDLTKDQKKLCNPQLQTMHGEFGLQPVSSQHVDPAFRV